MSRRCLLIKQNKGLHPQLLYTLQAGDKTTGYIAHRLDQHSNGWWEDPDLKFWTTIPPILDQPSIEFEEEQFARQLVLSDLDPHGMNVSDGRRKQDARLL